MGILEGKNILVAGVTLDTSIAFHVARIAQAEGANVIVSNFGRAMSLTGRVIKKLDPVPPLLEVDVTNSEHLAGLADNSVSTSTGWTVWCTRWPSPIPRPRSVASS